MSRGWKIGIGCFGIFVLACVLVIWGLWSAFGYLFWEGIGDIAGSDGSGGAAARYYARALKRRPDSSSLHLKLGQALAKSGENADALKEYADAARLDPDSTKPTLAQARLQTKTGDYPAAAETLKNVLAKAPNAPQAHLEYGRLLLAEKQPAKAVAEFEKALDLDRSLTYAFFDLGRAHEDAGQREAAIESYREGARRCDWRCRERLAALGQPYEGPTTPSSSPSRTSEEDAGEAMGAAAGFAFMSVFMVFYFVFFGLMMLLTLGSYVLKGLAVWDCARRDFPDPNTRAMWCLLMVLIGIIGVVIYYFLVYRHNDPPRQARPQALTATPGGG